MDLPMARAALCSSRRRRKWLLLLTAIGATGYGAYRVYHLPAVAEKRRRLGKLLRALASLAAAFSASAETVGLVSDDLNRFLRGDSDEMPPSIRQLSKIAASGEFSGSVARVTEALTAGVVRGVAAASDSGAGSKPEPEADPRVPERLLDKLFSSAGSGFASAVVGSFAKNLVIGFCDAQGGLTTASGGGSGALLDTEAPPLPAWVHLLCGDKVRRLIGDCVQVFVGTAVAVYLDKTMELNTFDEMFSGLTNPKHEAKVKDVLVSVCNGAVETLVKTSHKVLTCPPPSSAPSTDREDNTEVEEEPLMKHNWRSPADAGVGDGGAGWVETVSSTLSVPSNRSFVLDLTGRMTSETVRSVLDFVQQNLSHGAKQSVKLVHREVVERGMEVVRFESKKLVLRFGSDLLLTRDLTR
ncbi:hypothetical protein Taro_019247 [Colocasia esculenta]|uniref:Protein PHLOEM PROTEIN 2-LIKE A10 n=1 Tax=Colocasia esculenta TaxID=4460 RepID=A0A843UTG2_COLES|nr:hypothetical protein [Colocasia esculenta]